MEVSYIRVIKGFLLPLIGLVALIGNLLTIVVYYRQCKGGTRMRKSNNTFLISLSATFILMILIPLPWHIYAFTLGNLESNFTVEMCFLDFLYGTIPIIPQSVTILIVCALTIQRYSAIRYPLKANVWWNYKKAIIIVFISYVTSIVIHAIGYMRADGLQRNITLNIMEEMAPGMCLSVLKDREWIINPRLFGAMWLLLRNIFVGTLPNIILITFVVATVRLLQRRNQDLITGNSTCIYHMDKNPPAQRLGVPTRVVSSVAFTVSVVETFVNIVVILNVSQIYILDSADDLGLLLYLYQFQCIFLSLGTNSVFFHSCLLNDSFRKDLKTLIFSWIPKRM